MTVRLRLSVAACSLLVLAGCSSNQGPDEQACAMLKSVDQRIVGLYNETTDSSAKNVYLQELGKQAAHLVTESLSMSGLSEPIRIDITELNKLFTEPIVEFPQRGDATSNNLNGDSDGFEDGTIVGYGPKKEFSHNDVSAFVAKVDILCG